MYYKYIYRGAYMGAYLGNLTTEQINEKSKKIDMCSTEEILEIINSEDMLVPAAVSKEIVNITRAVDLIVCSLKKGGRLFYVGAGTSGRIGILDASECPPTYGTSPELVQAIIAGGNEAVFKSVEGAEDDEKLGRSTITDRGITDKDVVVGIAASGRTPFVIGALREAKAIGAVAIGISNNNESIIKKEADIAITPIVGPEVIMGSTRMKSGTAQKLVLNMITTAVMIKLGKVYGNLMVDLQPSNTKLIDRAVRIVMHASGADKALSRNVLERSGFSPKVAVVMVKTGVDKEEAERLLLDSQGFVTKALELYKSVHQPDNTIEG
jgi:N-acetylmuramic acid 6-phosphate etherase